MFLLARIGRPGRAPARSLQRETGPASARPARGFRRKRVEAVSPESQPTASARACSHRARRVAELAPRLAAVEGRRAAGDADPFAGRDRPAARDSVRRPFRRDRGRHGERRRDRHADHAAARRRPEPAEQLAQRPVLAAEDVALAGAPPLRGEQEARRHVPDVDEVQDAGEEEGRPSPQEQGEHGGRGRQVAVAGADRDARARDHHVEPVLRGRQRRVLGESLGAGVGPRHVGKRRPGGLVDRGAVGELREQHRLRGAVDHPAHPGLGRGAEQGLGALPVDPVEIVPVRAPEMRDGREVVGVGDAVERRPQRGGIEHGSRDELDLPRPVAGIGHVEHAHPVAAGDELRREVATDEAAPAGDQMGRHVRPGRPPRARTAGRCAARRRRRAGWRA